MQRAIFEHLRQTLNLDRRAFMLCGASTFASGSALAWSPGTLGCKLAARRLGMRFTQTLWYLGGAEELIR